MPNSFRNWIHDFATRPLSRLADIYIYYVIGIPANLVLTFNAWIWWLAKMDPGKSFSLLLASAIMHPVIVYETGYKKCYRRGLRNYFYFVFLLPGILSMLGIAVGLFVKGVP